MPHVKLTIRKPFDLLVSSTPLAVSDAMVIGCVQAPDDDTVASFLGRLPMINDVRLGPDASSSHTVTGGSTAYWMNYTSCVMT